MARCKIKRKSVFLDFEGTNKILASRGVNKTKTDVSSETGFSIVSVRQWGRMAPEVVAMIHHYLKDNMLKFEDLVKECLD